MASVEPAQDTHYDQGFGDSSIKPLSIKELTFLVSMLAPLTVLGMLAAWQTPNYFQATNALGLRAFCTLRWYWASCLMVSYSVIGCGAGLLITRYAGQIIDRWALQ